MIKTWNLSSLRSFALHSGWYAAILLSAIGKSWESFNRYSLRTMTEQTKKKKKRWWWGLGWLDIY